jgi:hypothetical protein
MQEPDGVWILDYLEGWAGGNLDNTSNWAQGHENLLIYTESTCDSYDLYVCTTSHSGPTDFGSEVYYYADHEAFSEEAIATLETGGSVYIDCHLWDDMEDDFSYALEQWWTNHYDDLFEDMKDELLESGEYHPNED